MRAANAVRRVKWLRNDYYQNGSIFQVFEIATAVPIGETTDGKQILVTCNHALPSIGATEAITVGSYSGIGEPAEWHADILARSSDLDLAIIACRMPAQDHLIPEFTTPESQDVAFCVGFPADEYPKRNEPSLVAGYTRLLDKSLIVEAATRKGFSGGPVLTKQGRWIGMIVEGEGLSAYAVRKTIAIPSASVWAWIGQQRAIIR